MDNQQPNQNNSPLPSWFSSSIPEGAVVQSAPSPSQPPHHRFRRKLVIISIVVAVALCATGVVLVLLQGGSTCLTAKDYLTLHEGATVDETFDPTSDFYSIGLPFAANTADYATDADIQQTAEIGHIAAFYKDHQDKPMKLSLTTSIQSDATSTLAAQRIDKVRNDLIAAGIPSGIITTSILTFDVSDMEDGTEASDTPDTVAISLTSAATCK